MRFFVGNLHTRVEGTIEEQSWLDDLLSFPDKSLQYAHVGDGRRHMYSLLSRHFPTGYVPLVRKASIAQGKAYERTDERTCPTVADWTADTAWLRDYQQVGLKQSVAIGRGILWIPTGGGKTEIAVALAQVIPCRWLFVVHRATLLRQTAERYTQRTGKVAGEVGDGSWSDFDGGNQFVVATFQSLVAAQRSKVAAEVTRANLLLASAQGIIVDECFPAGTLVDGRPIETVRVGDYVTAYHEATGSLHQRRVLRVWVTPSRSVVRVVFSDGREVVCTKGHPFRTRDGWTPALDLTGKDVLSYTHDVSNLWANLRADGTAEVRHAPSGNDSGMHQGMPAEAATLHERAAGPLRQNDGRQSHDRSESCASDGGCALRARGLAAEGAGGERTRSIGATNDAPSSARGGMAAGVRRANANVGTATNVPDRHREPNEDDCSGSRRKFTRSGEAGSRRTEGSLSQWVRVDRVEILQPRDSSESDSLCPGGVVYNLHVEDDETYLVNGIVVHNCHVLPANTFLKATMQTRNAYYRIGMSGTPLARGDRRSMLAVGALGPVICRIVPQTLIDAGVLAKPEIRMVRVRQFVNKPTWAGVYGEAIVRSHHRNANVVAEALKATKPCLVFVQHIKHGNVLLERMQKAGLRAEFVWGDDDTAERRSAVRRLEHGDLDVLITSVVMQEGIDIPTLRSVVIASGGQSTIAALQRIGRGMRVSADKTTFAVVDFADEGHKWIERHSRARLRSYRGEGYEVTVVEPSVANPNPKMRAAAAAVGADPLDEEGDLGPSV